MRPSRLVVLSSLLPLILLGAACTGDTAPAEDATPADGGDARGPESLTELLAAGHPVFGTFSGPTTPEQGATLVANRDADFVLYSMESGPFDIAGMQAYMRGMETGADELGVTPQPVILRVPPIHDDPAAAPQRVADALGAGVEGIVFPHVTTSAEAAASVAALGSPWPLGEDALDILIVEDREGVANVREIMATPGLSVVFAGPGDLRRAYDGDMDAVENAIQAVLAACLDFDVVCGVTAGVDDIADRLDQGFRMIIVTADDALPVGRAHAGR